MTILVLFGVTTMVRGIAELHGGVVPDHIPGETKAANVEKSAIDSVLFIC